MRRSQPKLKQLDLFGPPEGTCLLQIPQWSTLPCQTRNEVTTLVARLLMEHGHGERNELGGAVVDPLLSKENGDV